MTSVNFTTAMILISRGYAMRRVCWPKEDYIRRTHKSEPSHPGLVRIRGRRSDTTHHTYKPFLTNADISGQWTFSERDLKNDS